MEMTPEINLLLGLLVIPLSVLIAFALIIGIREWVDYLDKKFKE